MLLKLDERLARRKSITLPVGYGIRLLIFLFPSIKFWIFLLSSMLYVAFFCAVSFRRLALGNDCPAYWYLICVWVVVCVVKGRSISSALLGDVFLHFFWLDRFLLVLRQSTCRCKDSLSIDKLQRLAVVNARMTADPKLPPLLCTRTVGWRVLTWPRVKPT